MITPPLTEEQIKAAIENYLDSTYWEWAVNSIEVTGVDRGFTTAKVSISHGDNLKVTREVDWAYHYSEFDDTVHIYFHGPMDH